MASPIRSTRNPDEPPLDDQRAGRRKRLNKPLIRAGLIIMAGGFVVALIAAAVLGNRVSSLEGVASVAHTASKVILLAGLALVLAGYRGWNVSAGASLGGNPANMDSGKYDAPTHDDLFPTAAGATQQHPLAARWNADDRVRGRVAAATVLGTILLVILVFTLPNSRITLSGVLVGALIIGPVLSVLAVFARGPLQVFAVGAVFPWWMGGMGMSSITAGLLLSGPAWYAWRGNLTNQFLYPLLIHAGIALLSGGVALVAYYGVFRLGIRDKDPRS